jgi:hypothetical protein
MLLFTCCVVLIMTISFTLMEMLVDKETIDIELQLKDLENVENVWKSKPCG